MSAPRRHHAALEPEYRLHTAYMVMAYVEQRQAEEAHELARIQAEVEEEQARLAALKK